MHDDLERKLEMLTARLERIEAQLQIKSIVQDQSQAPAQRSVSPSPQSVIAPPLRPQATPPVAPAINRYSSPSAQPQRVVIPPLAPKSPPIAPVIPDRTAVPSDYPQPFAAPQSARNASTAWTGGTSAPVRVPPQRAPQSASSGGLEMLIGGKWMAWVGAITVVVAAAFFIMVGIDKGWWGRLSEGVRCLLIAAFGGLLICGGELALRRIGKTASVGLFGAGLGTLYLDAYATFKFFDLFSKNGAFGLMAIVAIAGFAITYRTRFLTIGVLSIVGGYLTPILLRGSSSHDIELLSYLTMLLGIALGLSAAMPRHFRALRYVALGCQLIVGLAWLVANSSQWMMAIVFMSLWWAMVMAEAVYAAMRRQSAFGNVLAVLLTTAAYVTGSCLVLNSAAPPASAWLGGFAAMIAVLGAAVALQFGPGLDGLREAPRQAMDKLAVALWAQSGALAAVAVALQFDGFGQSIGWLAIALAAVEVGRRLPSRGVTIFGFIVGAMALIRVAAWDWWMPGMDDVIWSSGSVTVTKWVLLALLTVLALHVAAHRVRAKPQAADRAPVVLAVIANLFWLAMCGVACHGMAMTAGWLLGAVILLALEPIGRRQRYFEIATGLLMLTVVRWLMIDAFFTRLHPAWRATDAAPVLNAQVAMAAAIIGAGWWAHRILRVREMADLGAQEAARRNNRRRQIWQLIGSFFGLIALSFEADRALVRIADPPAVAPGWLADWPSDQRRALWLTALWTIGGFIMMLIGWRRNRALVFRSGWFILAATAIVWLTYDTISWRLTEAPAPARTVFNLQFAVGALVAVLLGYAAHSIIRHQTVRKLISPWPAVQVLHATLALVAALGLWLGSFEIDRFFAAQPTTRQTGLSVYWGIYAVALVLLGFLKRAAAARYVGLALLTVTLAKVFFIDMRGIDPVWRAVSFAVIGLLLIGTSVAYARLAPRLLGEEPRLTNSD